MAKHNTSENDERHEPDPINLKTFKKYLNENGPERAKGYLDAIIAMNENIEACFFHYNAELKMEMGSSPNRTATSVKKFIDEMEYLVSKVQSSELLPKEPTIKNTVPTESNMPK